ncbi:hypothetical protein F5883DRAFT_545850 [Diaporthe sp. PMI_573]|nr:hypothetical protein F5883DRAFT_545850 [Diaporthaceae sp. PMI_573]
MAEYWKSTPRYWCKHCSVYVRDTKLERQNHEATAKHQGAVKRALRDLHRGHEREEREKERAKREIERLNGVVSSDGSGSTSTANAGPSSRTRPAAGAGASSGAGTGTGAAGPLSETERKRQAEQLASLGVSLPDEFRKDLAMAGDWQVTSTTIITETPADANNPGASARGVHKRERTDEEIEEDKAMRGLFKKPRRWGRDPRTAAGDAGSAELEALLSGGLTVKKQEEDTVKKEEDAGPTIAAVPVKEEEQERSQIKKEPPEERLSALAEVATDPSPKVEAPALKPEDGASTSGSPAAQDVPTVTFKKRKPKNMRQK